MLMGLFRSEDSLYELTRWLAASANEIIVPLEEYQKDQPYSDSSEVQSAIFRQTWGLKHPNWHTCV
jgi:hypothetical protein